MATTLQRAGWGLLALVPLHALPLLLDAAGWRVLVARHDRARRARLPVLFWASAIREAVARLLPLASVGGEIVGVRLAMRRGLAGAVAAAGVITQLLLSIVDQLLFAAAGAALLVIHTGATTPGVPAALLLATMALAMIGVIAVLPRGRGFTRLQGWLGASLRARLQLDGAALDAALHAELRAPRRLLAAAAWEFAGLVAGAAENWLALALLGAPVDAMTALLLEAAIQAARHLFFMMPAGLGVQEAGLVWAGPLLGVPAEAALALSLARRFRDLACGVPALLSWPYFEARSRREPG